MGSDHRMAGQLSRLLGLVALLAAANANAGQADVIKAEIRPDGDYSYRIDVTVQHADSGWDHYANRWEVLGPDDQIIATRVLHHPHVHEQPFTRSLGNIKIPNGLTWVKLRAHDLVHGHGGRQVTLSVPPR